MDSRDLARALRDEPPELDDIRRARMERNILEEVAVSEEPKRRLWILPAVAVAVAAALVLWMRPWAAAPVSESAIAFEALRDGVPVRSGTFAEGESLQTATDQLLRVRFGGQVEGAPNTLVELEPSTRVHFARVMGDARELELERGHVRVEFHPHRRGEESLAIQTPTARIEVVGTIFEVRVEEQVTHVSVQQGAVRVIPLEGETTIVRSGESRTVGRAAPLETPQITAETTASADTVAPSPRTVEPRDSYPPRALDPEVVETDLPQIEDTDEEVADDPGDPADALDGPAPREEADPLSEDARFDLAARYLDQGRTRAAKHELRAIARTTRSRSARARAWTEIAQIYESENEASQAAESYRRAANAGRGTTVGTNALFALGRMRSSLRDTDAAKVAYRRYLDEAPDGPLARQARRALCRLGDVAQCRE